MGVFDDINVSAESLREMAAGTATLHQLQPPQDCTYVGLLPPRLSAGSEEIHVGALPRWLVDHDENAILTRGHVLSAVALTGETAMRQAERECCVPALERFVERLEVYGHDWAGGSRAEQDAAEYAFTVLGLWHISTEEPASRATYLKTAPTEVRRRVGRRLENLHHDPDAQPRGSYTRSETLKRYWWTLYALMNVRDDVALNRTFVSSCPHLVLPNESAWDLLYQTVADDEVLRGAVTAFASFYRTLTGPANAPSAVDYVAGRMGLGRDAAQTHAARNDQPLYNAGSVGLGRTLLPTLAAGLDRTADAIRREELSASDYTPAEFGNIMAVHRLLLGTDYAAGMVAGIGRTSYLEQLMGACTSTFPTSGEPDSRDLADFMALAVAGLSTVDLARETPRQLPRSIGGPALYMDPRISAEMAHRADAAMGAMQGAISDVATYAGMQPDTDSLTAVRDALDVVGQCAGDGRPIRKMSPQFSVLAPLDRACEPKATIVFSLVQHDGPDMRISWITAPALVRMPYKGHWQQGEALGITALPYQGIVPRTLRESEVPQLYTPLTDDITRLSGQQARRSRLSTAFHRCLIAVDSDARMAASTDGHSVSTEATMAFQETSSGSSNRARQRALLIGIDAYEQPRVPDLRGCVNDVKAVKRLLIDRFQVPDGSIKMLTDEAATRANILDAFENHLIAGARAGDRVFVHYSGHGSQMKDVHGDEIDGKDETIVPHDSRDPQGKVFDINDDEIYDLLKRLQEKTSDVVIVFDCCHSGSATRAATTVRQIPMDEREPPAPTRTRAITPQEHGPGGMLPAAEGYVLVSGCRAEELSNEHTVDLRSGGTTKFGALTYHLVQKLIEAAADVTWEEVMEDVAPEVSAIYGSQHPQVEGAIRRRVFTSGAREEDPAFLVTEVDRGTVTLNGGAAHGLQEGVKVAFYPEDAYRFAESEPIANGRISDVGAIESTADVDGDAGVPVGARVRVLSPPMPELRLPVVLADGADQLESHLEDDPWVRLVSPEEARAPVVLRMRDADTIGIDDATGEPLTEDVPRTNIALLLTRLKHLARFRALMQLNNPDQVSALNRKVRLHFGLRGEGGGFVEPEHNAGGEPVVPIGEEMLLEVENLSNDPVYITLLVLDRQDYSVTALHPPPGAEDNKLAANDTFQLGTRGELRAQPPIGETTVLLIATESQSDFRSLWTSQMRSLDETTNPIERYFNRGLTRGLGLTEVEEEAPAEDWTAKRATIHVVEVA